MSYRAGAGPLFRVTCDDVEENCGPRRPLLLPRSLRLSRPPFYRTASLHHHLVPTHRHFHHRKSRSGSSRIQPGPLPTSKYRPSQSYICVFAICLKAHDNRTALVFELYPSRPTKPPLRGLPDWDLQVWFCPHCCRLSPLRGLCGSNSCALIERDEQVARRSRALREGPSQTTEIAIIQPVIP